MSPSATQPLPDRARAVGADVERAFAAVTRGIAAVRAASGEAAELVEALGETVAAAETAPPESDAGPTREFERAGDAARALAARLGAPELAEACLALEMRLDEAAQTAKELGVIAMMTKVALAESSWTRAEAETYSGTLESLTRRLSEVIATAQARAAPILSERLHAADEIAAAERALRGAGARVRERADAAEGLAAQRDAGLETLRGEARRLAAGMTAQIARLVPCLQFADELDQRIDHAIQILGGARAPDAAARAAARGIAAAQLAAVAADCAGVQAEAAEAARAIGRVAESGGGALAAADAGAIRRWLDASRAATESTRAATEDALAHLRRARDRLAAVVHAAAVADETIASFHGLVADLDIAACNASVASARASQRGGVLNFLAGCVAAASKRCAASLQASSRTLTLIRERLPTEEQQVLAERLEAFARGQDEAAAALAAQQASLEKQAEIGRALDATMATLAAAAARAETELDRARAPAAALSTIAEGLGSPRGRLAPAEAAWALSLYTTQAERRVHADISGGPAEAAPVEPAAEAEDEDLAGFLM